MKNFLIAIISIAVIAAILQQFLPWWSIAIAGFVVGFMLKQRTEASFFTGVLAIFSLWAIYASVLSHGNDSILIERIAVLLKPLTAGKAFKLYVLTGAVGALVTGFASLSGRLLAVLIGFNRMEGSG